MTDTYSPETRSRVMRQVKGKDTSPEVALRRALWARGVRGWRLHRRDLPGTPDLAFGGNVRLAVFVDGAFWHGHPTKYWPGRSGEYWDKKIARNIERDLAANDSLEELGWTVLRVWDFDVLRNPSAAADQVAAELSRLGESRAQAGDA
ncbi:MAG: very short patch repair endonuclease [Coriobacteriia bacterium]